MIKLLATLLAAIVLFGCTGVSREEYDSLRADCDSEKNALSENLLMKEAKASQLEEKLGKCEVELDTEEALGNQKDAKIADLERDSEVLLNARSKTGRIEGYRMALSYYGEAYGPGKVPNTPRLNRIENQVISLNDTPLYNIWKNVRGCGGIVECDSAKANFTLTANARITQLAMEAADILIANATD